MQTAFPKDRFNTPTLRAFLACDSGATAIEYALIASLIAVVILGAVSALGSSVFNMYQNTSNAISQ